ncbi:MAG: hypothetical protein ACI857_003412 [Arenicella sp.]|jgi:hypothetical protein
MKIFVLKFAVLCSLGLSLYSCHEDETYYCYLTQENWPETDTLGNYDEAFWFYKKKSKPQDECAVARAELIIQYNGDPNYVCDCICGWEDD